MGLVLDLAEILSAVVGASALSLIARYFARTRKHVDAPAASVSIEMPGGERFVRKMDVRDAERLLQK